MDSFTIHRVRLGAKDGDEPEKDLGWARTGVEGSGYRVPGRGSAEVTVTMKGIKIRDGGQEHQSQ